MKSENKFGVTLKSMDYHLPIRIMPMVSTIVRVHARPFSPLGNDGGSNGRALVEKPLNENLTVHPRGSIAGLDNGQLQC